MQDFTLYGGIMTHRTIKELPLSERPYERLETHGAHVLSNTELLAIIIRNGTKKLKAIDVASSVLNSGNEGLLSLHKQTIEELKCIDGIGRIKAIQLKALAELSVRMSKMPIDKKIKVTSPSVVAAHFMEQMRHLGQEQLIVVLLDIKNNIINHQIISKGTVESSIINPREILVYCLKHQCVNFILLHNHPSGDPTPSKEDILVTERIYTAGKLIGIHMLDHLVIGDRVYISLKEEGHLNYANQEIL